jgi:ADP-heptose:LPS heptosyltransferase
MIANWLNKLWYWTKYPFKFLLYQAIDIVVIQKKVIPKPKSVLIFRLDLVGDFVMSRAFFSPLNQIGRFKRYSLSLACNEIVKNLVEGFDEKTFDHVFYINRPKFLNNASYRFKILSEIREKGFEVVICPMHTRQFLLESVVRCSGAKLKIGTTGIGKHMFDWQQKMADSWYNELITNPKEPLFEFYRNQYFFNSLAKENLGVLNIKCRVKAEWLNKTPDQPFILFAPGASVAFRRWPTKSFAILAKQLHEKYKLQIFVIGSGSEKYLFDEIFEMAGKPEYLRNLCGELSLSQSIAWMSKAKLLISNESAPVHMAAMVDCPTICLSNGSHYLRWNSYPAEMKTRIQTIYPISFTSYSDLEKLYFYTDQCPIAINEITIDGIMKDIEEFGIKC